MLQIDAHIDWRKLKWIARRKACRRPCGARPEMAHVERIVQVGALRGIGSAREADYRDARASGVTLVTAYEVHRNGVEAALSSIPEGSEIVVLHRCRCNGPVGGPGGDRPSAGRFQLLPRWSIS